MKEIKIGQGDNGFIVTRFFNGEEKAVLIFTTFSDLLVFLVGEFIHFGSEKEIHLALRPVGT